MDLSRHPTDLAEAYLQQHSTQRDLPLGLSFGLQLFIPLLGHLLNFICKVLLLILNLLLTLLRLESIDFACEVDF